MYDYKIQQLDQNTYCLEEYAKTRSYLLLGDDKAMLIDTGCGCGNLRETVESITDKPLLVVNSHGHLDHIGANGLFEEIYISQADVALMQHSQTIEYRDKEMRRYLLGMDAEFDINEIERIVHLPVCSQLNFLTDGMKFDLGNRTIEAIHTPGHTAGCYCFLDAGRKQLFTADTICDISILLFLQESASLECYKEAIKKLTDRYRDIEVLYPGHHTYPLSPDYLSDYAICAEKILRGEIIGENHKESIGEGMKARYGKAAICYNPLSLAGNEAFLKAYRLQNNYPRIHYAPLFGWMNDPNGMVFHKGTYHLFHQHNPSATKWSQIHWGYTTSKDLIHWSATAEALLPDEHGYIYSGSGIIDEYNLLGYGNDTMVLYYTAAAGADGEREKAFTQRMAYSTDGGKHFIKDENFEIPSFTPENRDPKVIYHAPSKGYIMVMYLDEDRFWFWRSSDLRHFDKIQEISIPGFFECPDLIEFEWKQNRSLWAFTSARGNYVIGEFDGYTFTIITETMERFHGKQQGEERPDCMGYAAQTYFGTPNRWINQYWIMYPDQHTSYAGNMSLPQEITLHEKNQKYFLTFMPVNELKQLRKEEIRIESNKGRELCYCYPVNGEAVEIVLELQNQKSGCVTIHLLQEILIIDYDAKMICLNKKTIQWQEEDILNLRIFMDIDVIELFALEGKHGIVEENSIHDLTGEICVHSDQGSISKAVIYPLDKIW